MYEDKNGKSELQEYLKQLQNNPSKDNNIKFKKIKVQKIKIKEVYIIHHEMSTWGTVQLVYCWLIKTPLKYASECIAGCLNISMFLYSFSKYT